LYGKCQTGLHPIQKSTRPLARGVGRKRTWKFSTAPANCRKLPSTAEKMPPTAEPPPTPGGKPSTAEKKKKKKGRQLPYRRQLLQKRPPTAEPPSTADKKKEEEMPTMPTAAPGVRGQQAWGATRQSNTPKQGQDGDGRVYTYAYISIYIRR